MGCCLSIQNKCPKKQDHTHDQHPTSNVHKSNPTYPEHKPTTIHEIQNHKASPPEPLVEETVKEVVSETETPISKPQVSTLKEETNTQMAIIEPHHVAKSEKLDEISEVSEICSVNDATTIVVKNEEEEVTSKKLNQPLLSNVAKKRSCSSERRLKSPARRSEASPEKKRNNQVNMRSVRGRESGVVATRKANVGPGKVGRDGGEASRRRSKSPATMPERVGENGGSEKGVVLPESIDNPHVSLECFIFL